MKWIRNFLNRWFLFTELAKRRLFQIDQSVLESGRNVLLDQVQKGIFSVVFQPQLSSRSQDVIDDETLFLNRRLEIVIEETKEER